MEHRKILNLLNEASDSKFVTRKWNIVKDQWNTSYDVGNEIIYNTEMLKYSICDYNDGYILVKTIIGCNLATELAFKKHAPFTKCITKIDWTTTDDVEDLDLVMLMHNLLEYSWNYSDATGSLWFYFKDEATTFNADIEDSNFKPFKYKAKLLESVSDGDIEILKKSTMAWPCH